MPEPRPATRSGRRPRLRRFAAQLRPLLEEAIEQLRIEWRGHALTLIGIVWGAASVILLLSLGTGFTRFLDLGMEKTGDRWLKLSGGYTSAEADGRRPGRKLELGDEDLALLRAGVPSAALVAAETQFMRPVETLRRTRATVISAGDAGLQRVQNHEIERGRYFDDDDARAGRRLAVLGAELAGIFFGETDPLGRELEIDGVPFEVVGVLAAKGFQFVSMMDMHDRMVFVPLDVGRRLLGENRAIEDVYLNLVRLEDDARARAEARAALAPLHHLAPDDGAAIEMFSVPEIIAPTRNIFVALQLLLGLVGTVTLAMAGVGVANLMLAIVNERRREFAMRRACGARRSDVLLQLLAETSVIVLLGGTAGALLGVSLVASISALPLPAMIPQPRLSAGVVLTTFGVLVLTGLAAGLLPARKAAQIDPAQALRVP